MSCKPDAPENNAGVCLSIDLKNVEKLPGVFIPGSLDYFDNCP
jgi:hypothetical protein